MAYRYIWIYESSAIRMGQIFMKQIATDALPEYGCSNQNRPKPENGAI